MQSRTRGSGRVLSRTFALLAGLISGAPALQPAPSTAAVPQLVDRYPERWTKFPDGVSGLADVTYSELGGYRPLTLDLYVPATDGASRPAILFVHGGGWMSGHSRHAGTFEDWPRVLAAVAARGFVVASANYRLSSEAPFPAAALDVKSAIAWLRHHAAKYQIDIRRIGIWGASAGGQLAALAGTTCGLPQFEPQAKPHAASSCVQAVTAWYGVFDFGALVRDGNIAEPVAKYLGCAHHRCDAGVVQLASPISHASAAAPPFLLIHGSDDRTVPAAQSRSFHAALKKSGVRTSLLMLEGIDHSFVGSTPAETREASLRALEATLEFFDAELRPDTGARRPAG